MTISWAGTQLGGGGAGGRKGEAPSFPFLEIQKSTLILEK